MRILVSGLLLLAILTATGTAVLVKGFLDSERTTQMETPTEREVVAPKELYVLVSEDELVTGKEISSSDVALRRWPEEMVNDAFILSEHEDDELLDEFVGAIARTKIPAGIPITHDMVFRRSEAGFLTGILSPGMRAVSIAIQPQTAAAGFILPGNYVDVIVTYDFRSDNESQGNQTHQAAETILEKIRVVAVDQELESSDGEAIVATTVTLEVTPKGAETISLSSQVGQIHLSLRSLSSIDSDSQKAFTPDYEIFRALKPSVMKDRQIEEISVERYSQPEANLSTEPTPQIKIYRGVAESVSTISGR